jgi:hypothetical protein
MTLLRTPGHSDSRLPVRARHRYALLKSAYRKVCPHHFEVTLSAETHRISQTVAKDKRTVPRKTFALISILRVISDDYEILNKRRAAAEWS